jgi:hypothetical protein
MGAKNLAKFDVETVHPIQEVQTNPARVDVHSLENFTESSPRVATSHTEDIHTMIKTVSQQQDFKRCTRSKRQSRTASRSLNG